MYPSRQSIARISTHQKTLVHSHLVDLRDNDFVPKIAKTTGEASQLIESGFDYICTTVDVLMLFRKRI